ncbi:single-stranded-DNA-specific exonuclease RecJ [Otariodibacter oris]|uniref:Single-stranded-DNA-specific exonuclease RecJ n=1 Tax=Otariodibacter oris TaxID=1032623 RepID=A0A420XIG9_9PAST|nr:single-stranded-DNA-specific exonuclease RecJ [Otariodibacter oris]QGM80725.1 single-stranded-DNA-specific exonuclease RecJ [Otariodibacter oris]RKR77112.1 single-stranded-DNA-specific exonuclease [Otariodibacter oris]
MNKLIRRRTLKTTKMLSDNPLLNRIYQAREISSPDELNLSLKGMLNPQSLSNIDIAVELLYQSYLDNKHITIVGDFDTDGATSTALVLLALRQFGFKKVDYLIPDRISQGYGLSLDIAELLLEKGSDVVLTVDNGVSSVEGIELLKSNNVCVIVTDHHLPADYLPNADAIVNPNLDDCTFPSKALAGVGVAFYVMVALRIKFRKNGVFKDFEPNITELLDLVALGTVADVVPLDHNNRILVFQGLNRIRAGVCRVGIKALVEISKRNLGKLQASDLGFSIAPRLNAAGRLENMSLGVELLICDDINTARQLALELDSLNQTRKEFEQDMKTEALAICAKLPHLKDSSQAQCIVVYQEDWHQGVIGILASRLKDQFHRPAIVFAKDGDLLLRGSARSISGVHIRDVLERVNSNYPNLIVKFGGHAMAAGLTIKEENLLQFQHYFNQVVQDFIEIEQLQGVIYTDGELREDELTLDTAELLQKSGPWGQYFPEPMFEGEFKILQQRIVGQNHLKLILETKYGKCLDAIWFNIDRSNYPDMSLKKANIVYKLTINEFRGEESLQLLVEELYCTKYV